MLTSLLILVWVLVMVELVWMAVGALFAGGWRLVEFARSEQDESYIGMYEWECEGVGVVQYGWRWWALLFW